MPLKETIRIIEEKVHELPVADATGSEVISLLDDPESNFDQIVNKLSPGLATRFLNMANSASYGREVRSISYAVKILGYDRMKQILRSSILIDQLSRQPESFSYEKFREQARLCAAVSKALGKIFGYAKPEDLYTAAMLQNIGKFIIALYFKDELQEIIRLKRSGEAASGTTEKKVLGMDHAELGAFVLKKFNVPRDIREAVRRHEADDGVIDEEMDFELEFISREATRIVKEFRLPEHMEPREIMGWLQGPIDEGREMRRDAARDEIRTRGYPAVFPILLRKASALIRNELSKRLGARASW
ncbi:MAG: HDOD domain-containing protein [Desulfobacterales bacterium]|nr:HDOD domain-containing protein [Desulfobacterales bacterium]